MIVFSIGNIRASTLRWAIQNLTMHILTIASFAYLVSSFTLSESALAQPSKEEQKWDWVKGEFNRRPDYLQRFLQIHPESIHAEEGRLILSTKKPNILPTLITSDDPVCTAQIERAVKDFGDQIERSGEYVLKTEGIRIPNYKLSVSVNDFRKSSSVEIYPIDGNKDITPIENVVFLDIGKNANNECAIIYRWNYGRGLPACKCAAISTSLESKLAAHFQENKIPIAAEGTQTGTYPDGTTYIKMFTVDFLTFTVKVFSSEAAADRALIDSHEKLNSNSVKMGIVTLARNGNLLINIVALSTDMAPQAQAITKAFSTFKP